MFYKKFLCICTCALLTTILIAVLVSILLNSKFFFHIYNMKYEKLIGSKDNSVTQTISCKYTRI